MWVGAGTLPIHAINVKNRRAKSFGHIPPAHGTFLPAPVRKANSPRQPPRAGGSPGESRLCLSVETAVEKRIHRLATWNREIHVGAVRPALEIETSRKHLVLRSTVLPDQASKVGQPLPPAEGPEGFLPEEQRRRVGRVPGSRQRRHRRHGGNADRRPRLPQFVEN